MRVTAVIIALLAVFALAACGSSKPAYCSTRTDLENSVKGLTTLNASSGINGLKDQLGKILTNVNTLVSQAKSDFPSQTSAMKSSFDSLKSDVNAISATPSASQIGALATSASTFATSVKSFIDATGSKCS